ncbi:hypothetical protein VNO77_27549 [Canavalia gladiata]|uniref:Uncharacterized protein n=1 Tax=Canavalia gladiata TaxID=3824 RepID=A0AAN9KZ25_CANGL
MRGPSATIFAEETTAAHRVKLSDERRVSGPWAPGRGSSSWCHCWVKGNASAIRILSHGGLCPFGMEPSSLLSSISFCSFLRTKVRSLEALLAILIGMMATSFAWVCGKAKPNGKELLLGVLVPKLNSRTIQ